jgi:amidase
MTLGFDSATELARKIRDKDISSRELTDYFIARIEKFDADVNAVVVRDFDAARAAADAADAGLANGKILGPLHGLPMTIKESYNLTGLPTTFGIPMYKDNIATEDSDTVAKFKAAGAHFMGKTNVPLQLADFQSYNDIYGTTNNPWNLERIPGGSSGGSAAALAAGMTGLESGSDIGGSIRNPAHFCGVYGHKPTWGIVPFQGHTLPGALAPPDIAVVGPLARSADDLALCMDLVAGADHLNAPGWQLNLPRPTKKSLADYRIAIWADDERAPVSQEVADRVHAVGDQLAALGATVSDAARPAFDIDRGFTTYMSMLNAVMSAGMPEEEFEAAQQQVAALDPNDDSDQAQMARAAVQHHRVWLRGNHFREHLRMVWRAFFNDWDILICPQTATTAFPHDHSPVETRTLTVNNETQDYFKQVFWAGIITVGYLPSTVFPTGPSREGLPIGLQAVGAEFNDYQCIDFARLVAEEFGGFQPPPGYED